MLEGETGGLWIACPFCGEAVVKHPMNQAEKYCESCDRPLNPKQCVLGGIGFEDQAFPFIFFGTQWLVPFTVVKSDKRYLRNCILIAKNMEEVFWSMANGETPGKGCPEDWVIVYLQDLVNKQRFDCPPLKPGSWALPETAYEMEDGGDDDFIFLPTLCAVGMLALTFIDRPEMAKKINGLEKALSAGLNFSTLKGLSGHGYEALDYRLNALAIFEYGKVFELLLNRPEFSPSMVALLGDIHTKNVNLLNEEKGEINWRSFGPSPRKVFENIAAQTKKFAGLQPELRQGDPEWYRH